MSPTHPNRGDVVLVQIPYLDATASVQRPALIVSDPAQMLDIIIAGITSRIRDPLPTTHYVVDPSHADWTASGLRTPSAIRCDRLFTIDNADIRRTIGHLSSATMQHIDGHLKTALGLS
jgi:mRNA-degrading endonuclease toxin of MazEF toxin-antitoxin module